MIIVTTPLVPCQECHNLVPESDAVKFHHVEDAGYTDEGKPLLRATGNIIYECQACDEAYRAQEDAENASQWEAE